MKIDGSTVSVDVEALGESLPEKEMSIRLENLGFAAKAFTQYSDPISSLVREVTSNCFDAHAEAGMINGLTNEELIKHKEYEPEEIPYLRATFQNWTDKPVQVLIRETNTLSNLPQAIIFRDYGVGIAPSRMRKVYSEFFTSTKRHSNAEIGAFGLGAKSPLGYTDMFTVITVWRGVEYTYLIRQGNPMPIVSLISEIETTEHNGTRVEILIKDGDLFRFSNAVLNQLAYFDNIQFINCGTSREVWKGDYFYYKPYTFDLIHIVLGSVYYPLDVHTLERVTGKTLGFINCGIGLKFDVGELDVVWNRETLEYTERSCNVILNRLQDAKNEIQEIRDLQLEDIDNFKDWYVEIQRQKDKTIELAPRLFLSNADALINIETRYPKYDKLTSLPKNPWHYFLQSRSLLIGDSEKWQRYSEKSKKYKTPPSIKKAIDRLILKKDVEEEEDYNNNTHPVFIMRTKQLNPALTHMKAEYFGQFYPYKNGLLAVDKYDELLKLQKQGSSEQKDEEGNSINIYDPLGWLKFFGRSDFGLKKDEDFTNEQLEQAKAFLEEAYLFACESFIDFDEPIPEEFVKAYKASKRKGLGKGKGRTYFREDDEVAIKEPSFNFKNSRTRVRDYDIVEWKMEAWKAHDIEDYTGLIIYGFDSDLNFLNLLFNILSVNRNFLSKWDQDAMRYERKPKPLDPKKVRLIRIGSNNEQYFKPGPTRDKRLKMQQVRSRVYIRTLLRNRSQYISRWATARKMLKSTNPKIVDFRLLNTERLDILLPGLGKDIEFIKKYVSTYAGYNWKSYETFEYRAGSKETKMDDAIAELVESQKWYDKDAIKVFNRVQKALTEYPLILTAARNQIALDLDDLRAYIKGKGNVHPALLARFGRYLSKKRRSNLGIS